MYFQIFENINTNLSFKDLRVSSKTPFRSNITFNRMWRNKSTINAFSWSLHSSKCYHFIWKQLIKCILAKKLFIEEHIRLSELILLYSALSLLKRDALFQSVTKVHMKTSSRLTLNIRSYDGVTKLQINSFMGSHNKSVCKGMFMIGVKWRLIYCHDTVRNTN